jgi:hypothetical protein
MLSSDVLRGDRWVAKTDSTALPLQPAITPDPLDRSAGLSLHSAAASRRLNQPFKHSSPYALDHASSFGMTVVVHSAS